VSEAFKVGDFVALKRRDPASVGRQLGALSPYSGIQGVVSKVVNSADIRVTWLKGQAPAWAHNYGFPADYLVKLDAVTALGLLNESE